MLFRFMFICLVGYIALSASAAPANQHSFPAKLEGTWEQVQNDEKGKIKIVITEKEGDTIRGLIILTGSTYCKDPIPFRGKGGGNTAKISGDAPIICGYHGELSGEVTRLSNETYRGNFSYKLLNMTWAEGTFRLTPMKE